MKIILYEGMESHVLHTECTDLKAKQYVQVHVTVIITVIDTAYGIIILQPVALTTTSHKKANAVGLFGRGKLRSKCFLSRLLL